MGMVVPFSSVPEFFRWCLEFGLACAIPNNEVSLGRFGER
jgi:hypothetical protein